MSSVWGNSLKISLWGESHGQAIGAVLDGFPHGYEIDEALIETYMERRAGGGELSTSRREPDKVRILSGVKDGFTTGAPMSLMIENTSARSSDYGDTLVHPRPGHADYPAYVKYGGYAEHRGGGHFSGRLTAPLTAAGALCAGILAQRYNIHIAAHLVKIGTAEDERFDPIETDALKLAVLRQKAFPALSPNAAQCMREQILEAKSRGDSIGGIIECAAVGLSTGIGGHAFASLEGAIASIMFGIPALKGIEFGAGFSFGAMYGSQANDPYTMYDGIPRPVTNNAGGILGGMSTGAPVIFSAAFKPTPSIFLVQKSVDLKRSDDALLQIQGRHDPCVAVRAVPVVECCCAAAILDTIISAG